MRRRNPSFARARALAAKIPAAPTENMKKLLRRQVVRQLLEGTRVPRRTQLRLV